MYRVLYRKWRPQVFNDVVGQPQVTQTLLAQVRENRLSHAYLFTGSRGTGKTTCAKILSKAVNCLHPQNGNPCNQCEICKGIDNGTVLDIVEIDAASNRGIDDIRLLRDEVNFTPSQAKYRVYIIDEVHMLTIEAFNALLKTLEEPPEHVKFILATTEVHKLPSTILSRCQRFDFKRIEPDVIADRLLTVAKAEQLALTPDAAMLIARIADGGMRDALSLLDRASSVSTQVTSSVVSASAGLMGREYIYRLVEALSVKDASQCLILLDELHKQGCDTQRLCTELSNQFRNFLIIKTVSHPENLIICTDEELSRLRLCANAFAKEQILYILNVLNEAAEAMKRTQNRRIEAEMALIRLCAPNEDTDTGALLARIAMLEKELSDVKQNGVKTAFSSPKNENPSFVHLQSPVHTAPTANAVTDATEHKPEKKEADSPKVAQGEAPPEKIPSEEALLDEPPFDEPPFDEPPFDEVPPPEDDDFSGEPPYDEPVSTIAKATAAQSDFAGFGEEPKTPTYADRFADLEDDIPEGAVSGGSEPTEEPPHEKFDYHQFMAENGYTEAEDEPDFPQEKKKNENNDIAAGYPTNNPEKNLPNAPKPQGMKANEPANQGINRAITPKEWTKIVLSAERDFKPLIGQLESATAQIRGEAVMIHTPHEFVKKVLNPQILSDHVAPAVEQVLGKKYTVKIDE